MNGFYYSYVGEGFNFLQPRINKGLFNFKNGWLLYTPIMILSVLGLFARKIRTQPYFLAVLILTIIHIYIIYSWWNWYYINGFGSRPMVELYALLAFPFAFSIQYFTSNKYTKHVAYVFIVFCIALNQFQTYQHHIGVLWTEFANKNYYLSVFGKTKLSRNNLIVWDNAQKQPKYPLISNRILAFNDFESDDDLRNQTDVVWTQKRSMKLIKDQSPELEINLMKEKSNKRRLY